MKNYKILNKLFRRVFGSSCSPSGFRFLTIRDEIEYEVDLDLVLDFILDYFGIPLSEKESFITKECDCREAIEIFLLSSQNLRSTIIGYIRNSNMDSFERYMARKLFKEFCATDLASNLEYINFLHFKNEIELLFYPTDARPWFEPRIISDGDQLRTFNKFIEREHAKKYLLNNCSQYYSEYLKLERYSETKMYLVNFLLSELIKDLETQELISMYLEHDFIYCCINGLI